MYLYFEERKQHRYIHRYFGLEGILLYFHALTAGQDLGQHVQILP